MYYEVYKERMINMKKFFRKHEESIIILGWVAIAIFIILLTTVFNRFINNDIIEWQLLYTTVTSLIVGGVCSVISLLLDKNQ